MPNRRITQFPVILPGDIDDQDVLTLVHVFEVDPALRNKKITFENFRAYLDNYYINVNEIDPFIAGNVIVSGYLIVSGESTFDNNVLIEEKLTVKKDVTVSGDVFISGDVRIESGIVVEEIAATSINTSTIEIVSGNFVKATGVTIDFVSGYFDSISGTTVTGVNLGVVSGIIVDADINDLYAQVAQIDTLTADNVTFTGILTHSGTINANDINATGTIFGATIRSENGQFTNITGQTAVFTSQVSGNTITGNSAFFERTTGTFIDVTNLSGTTITGDYGQFLNLTGFISTATLFSGITITGDTANLAATYGTSGFFTNLSGTTITGVSGLFKNLDVQTLTAANLQFSGDQTVSGSFTVLENLFISGSGYIASGISVTGEVSGQTITAQSGNFDTIITAPTITGGTISGDNVYVSGTITGTTIATTSGHFVTATGTSAEFTTFSGVSGVFTNVTGTLFSGTTINAQTGIFASGSAAAPSITFVEDNNTGFFVTSGSVSGQLGDVLGVTTSGTEHLRINPFGAIGLQGENFGTHGQPLVSRGSGTTPYWSSNLSGLTITGGNINVQAGNILASTDISGLRISGGVINSLTEVQAASGAFTGTVTGNTFTGITAQVTTGIFNTLASGTTANFVTGIFANVTGETAGFTTVTGITVTGESVLGTTGIFAINTSNTITGTALAYTTGTFQDLFVDDDFIIGDDLTISGDVVIKGITTLSGVVTFASGFASQTGVTITGTLEATKGIFGSGTVNAPSITFKDDSDTGFYTDAGNKINATAAGAKRVTITSGTYGAVLTIWGS